METITSKNMLTKVGNGIAKAVQAQNILRIIGIPFQRLIDRKGETHKFLTNQGISILEQDGKFEAGKFFRVFADTLIKGNYWADTLWKNSTHHYNPDTGKGLWIWPGANEQCRNWLKGALTAWDKGNLLGSIFLIGASLHTVQDVCQPYHSNCIMLNGHQKYESWVDKNKELYAVNNKGIYDLSKEPEGWITANARFSFPFADDLASLGQSVYSKHTELLLSRAQRTTAGFLEFCFAKVCEINSLAIDFKSAAMEDTVAELGKLAV